MIEEREKKLRDMGEEMRVMKEYVGIETRERISNGEVEEYE